MNTEQPPPPPPSGKVKRLFKEHMFSNLSSFTFIFALSVNVAVAAVDFVILSAVPP